MQQKKAQSATEYLMTYGWALIIVIVIIAALVLTYGFNPINANSLSGFVGSDIAVLNAVTPVQSLDPLQLIVSNQTGRPLTLDAQPISVSNGSIPLTGTTTTSIGVPPVNLNPGERITLTFIPDGGWSGGPLDLKVTITGKDPDQFNKTSTGTVHFSISGEATANCAVTDLVPGSTLTGQYADIWVSYYNFSSGVLFDSPSLVNCGTGSGATATQLGPCPSSTGSCVLRCATYKSANSYDLTVSLKNGIDTVACSPPSVTLEVQQGIQPKYSCNFSLNPSTISSPASTNVEYITFQNLSDGAVSLRSVDCGVPNVNPSIGFPFLCAPSIGGVSGNCTGIISCGTYKSPGSPIVSLTLNIGGETGTVTCSKTLTVR